MEILDAEVLADVPNKGLAIRGPRRYDLAATIRTHQPAARRVGVAVLVFLLRTLPVDILRGIATWWQRLVVDYLTLASIRREEERHNKPIMSGEKRIEEKRQRIARLALAMVVLLVGGLVFWWWAPPTYHQAVVVVLVVGWFCTGHTWRRPGTVDPGQRLGWDGTTDSLRHALVAAKVIKDDQPIYLVGRPTTLGKGVQIVVDLPAGTTWEHVRKKLAALASAMLVSSEFMLVEPGDHDAQMKLWVPDGNPFGDTPERCPLMDAEQWDAWDPAPFGRTAHGLNVDLRLVYSNYLGGGLPGSGKSYTARVAAAPYILDPTARIFTANGKGDKAWEAVAGISDEYIRGSFTEDAWRLNTMLDQVIAEMDDRYRNRLQGSKLAPTDNLPLWLVIVDELQNYTTCPEVTEESAWGKPKATLGLVIAFKLAHLAKNARAAGIVMMLLTQKPSDKSLPLELRDQIGTRFANRVGNHHVSTMILGHTPAEGVDASKISTKHKGLGVLIPDMEEGDIEGWPTVRPYLISDDDWVELGTRGAALRGTTVERELPELLAAILEDVADHRDDDRVSSVNLRDRVAPDMTQTAFGRQLGRWGAPSSRDPGNKGPSGPLVGDLRQASKRIRRGGPIDILKAA